MGEAGCSGLAAATNVTQALPLRRGQRSEGEVHDVPARRRSLNQDQPGQVVGVGAGEQLGEEPAEAEADRDERPGLARCLKRGMQVGDNIGSGLGRAGLRVAGPWPARSKTQTRVRGLKRVDRRRPDTSAGLIIRR